MHKATVLAGIPAENASLFHRLPLSVVDPAAWIQIRSNITVILRDIEVDRARQRVTATNYACPADYEPSEGLSPDRATATAQSVAEFLALNSVDVVETDRTLPYIYAWHIQRAGIEVQYNETLGVSDRRTKSEQELEYLRKAQEVTEQAMEYACTTVAKCQANLLGELEYDGDILTSERLKAMIASFLINKNFTMNHGAIVAIAPDVADCHHSGSGPLKTETPVIVDIFPRDEETRYWGDCTRTVVHGRIPDTVQKMHDAVVQAKAAAVSALHVGATGDAIHNASTDVLKSCGFPLSRGTISDEPSIQHGTGHGIGLEVHEPILLDDGGPEIVENEVVTIEPGLYGRFDGGVRVEDMVVATQTGPENLNQLHEGLHWK